VLTLRERLDSGAFAGPGASAGPRGSVVLLAAPAAVIAEAGAYGVYGSVPGAALMRAIKDQFDPDHRMFPGRLAAI